MKKVLVVLFFTLFVLQGVSWSTEAGPTADLKPVLEELTAILNDETLKGDEHRTERRQKIMSQAQKGFDFREMSKRVLGSKTWKTIDEEQRDYFTQLLTKLLENVYIGKLEGYSGQGVEYVGEKIKGKKAQVTTLIEDQGAKFPVHYIMLQNSEKWMVYDINIEGVSLIRNYHEQFKSILRKDKYEGLVKVLEEKNKSFVETAQ